MSFGGAQQPGSSHTKPPRSQSKQITAVPGKFVYVLTNPNLNPNAFLLFYCTCYLHPRNLKLRLAE